ncbi:hypothetical protein ABIA39_002012 [Nocardia sp. GAS34]|uniref:DUF3237 family protein n=1 Tax=unclassified Nocardia TaxID=2637762 RepID=UPI003D19EBEA
MVTTALPAPALRPVLRIEAELGAPVDLGQDSDGNRRRFIPHVAGTFAGSGLSGAVVPGMSGDRQMIHPDGSSIGNLRVGLRTEAGAALTLEMRATRYGPPAVLARLAAGEPVDPSEYTFRGDARFQVAADELRWLALGAFAVVAGRAATGVAFEIYLIE